MKTTTITDKHLVGEFEKMKERNRLEKKKKKLQKKLEKHKNSPVVVGDLMELNQSFQKVVDEQGRLSYQLNVNFRAIIKSLVDKKIITEEDLSGNIKSLLEEDKQAFLKIQKGDNANGKDSENNKEQESGSTDDEESNG